MLRVVRPPLPEQTAITCFLDHATSRIERYIRSKEKLIALLEEQEQVIVYDAVTGRINVHTSRPYPAYEDSGLEWLGAVPVNWEIRRTKALFRLRTEKSGSAHGLELLREYRTRLITDVVTGKLDVREAAAKLPELAPVAGGEGG